MAVVVVSQKNELSNCRITKLRFFNTLTRQLEEFKPLHQRKVGLYSCGPTVYDYTHIGHVRTYVFVDILKRVLRYLDYQVLHVMNITDVGHLTSDADTGEDKMEVGARREKKTVWEIARLYTNYFFQVMKKVNVSKPNIICKATEHIDQMVKLVRELEIRGFTYKTSDGIYFDTSKFPHYGRLARLDRKGLLEGARVEKNPEKKNPTDFALWKFTPSGARRQMEWDSPWAPPGVRGKVKGFPGWHIECSAMSMKYLGPTIDVHTGGIDHIPTHHTNEIAQSETATGKPFVRYWMHAGHLLVEGEKMSKSTGNFYRLEEIEKKGFHALALRYLFLTAHYRSTLNFTWEALEGAQKAWERLRNQITNYKLQITKTQRVSPSPKRMKSIDQLKKRFHLAINNDLDMPASLALVWEVVKSNIPEYDKRELLIEWDQVLGLDLTKSNIIKVGAQRVAPAEIKLLIKERDKLRKQKQWQEADKIRKKIKKKGYKVEDTPKGTRVKPGRVQ